MQFSSLKLKYSCQLHFLLDSSYYFNYKLLKGRVKEYSEQTKEGDRRRVLKEFSKLLDDEVHVIVPPKNPAVNK